jgi:hypothetical protein
MRAGLIVLALAACSAPAARGPAWPQTRSRAVDGGESLAPRAAARSITAVVEDDKPDRSAADKPAAPSASSATPATTTPDKPAAPPAVANPDEPVITDEIVIEVEDKD